mmetsp:Transcript_11270/g.21174  ORF Transcript_11270/g.21174 Transcript_11270/m.21174 type:complete len:185 (+) Transcript_11270:204-758(+)
MRVILFLTILALSTCYAQGFREKFEATVVEVEPYVCIRGRGPGCDDGEDTEPVADLSRGSAMTSSSSTSLPDNPETIFLMTTASDSAMNEGMTGQFSSPQTFLDSFILGRTPMRTEEVEITGIPEITGMVFGAPTGSGAPEELDQIVFDTGSDAAFSFPSNLVDCCSPTLAIPDIASLFYGLRR